VNIKFAFAVLLLFAPAMAPVPASATALTPCDDSAGDLAASCAFETGGLSGWIQDELVRVASADSDTGTAGSGLTTFGGDEAEALRSIHAALEAGGAKYDFTDLWNAVDPTRIPAEPPAEDPVPER